MTVWYKVFQALGLVLSGIISSWIDEPRFIDNRAIDDITSDVWTHAHASQAGFRTAIFDRDMTLTTRGYRLLVILRMIMLLLPRQRRCGTFIFLLQSFTNETANAWCR